MSRLASNGDITRENGVMVGTTMGRVVELALSSNGKRLVADGGARLKTRFWSSEWLSEGLGDRDFSELGGL